MSKNHRQPVNLTSIRNLLEEQQTPSVMFDENLLVNGDNYGWLPDATIDLVLTDPPFNIARDTNFHTYKDNTVNSYRFDAGKGWDSYSQEEFIQLLRSWALDISRVLRPGGSFAIFCADRYLSHLIEALELANLSPKRTLTWRKPNAVPVNRKSMMMSACEYVVIGVKGAKPTFNADIDLDTISLYVDVERVLVADKVSAIVDKHVREQISLIQIGGPSRVPLVKRAVNRALKNATIEVANRVESMYILEDNKATLRGCIPNHVAFTSKGGKRLHPTEKPVQLLNYLIALLSKEGDTVLDPFSGSGSTGESALSLSRKVILVERDTDFYNKSSNRLTGLI